MPATKLTDSEAIAIARTTPITRGGISDLAKRIPPTLEPATVDALLDSAGSSAAMALAFALAAAKKPVPATLTRSLLAEVFSLDHVGPLAHATEGGALEVLVDFLEDERGDLELECLAMLLAADALGAERVAAGAVPKTLLVRGRWLARHKIAGDAGVYLGGAVLRLKDKDLGALAAPHVNRARRAKKTIDEALEIARMPMLDVLDDVDGARVSSGFTVRHETPSVGRNDPCPCGSGKKYKKCHALAEEAPPSAAEPPKLDAAKLSAEQTALLRPSEIAGLETARLSPKAFVTAFRRVVDLRQWPLALRMIDEAKAERALGIEPTSLALEALHGAYDARARDTAEELHALLPADVAAEEALAIECLRVAPDLLERIEKEAEDALRRDADGARGMLLASSLLRWYPALGIYVARGALHEGRTHDSQALLERIEDARDRLLLSPFEAWWDVYDAFFEDTEDRDKQKKEDAAREKMKADLRRARAASRKTAAEMEKLERRVAELDASIAESGPPKSKSDPRPVRGGETAEIAPELAEERRRLKTKIDELQRIIGEGQEERRELRRQLAEREEDDEDDEAPRGRAAHESDGEPEGIHDVGSIDAPRAILVPRFSDRAAKAVADLVSDAADGVFSVVAGLAAGRPNAWSGVKQLTKVRGVLSARAGIHHRVLFTVEPGERSLEVLEVLHRKDLEQVVARLSRTGA